MLSPYISVLVSSDLRYCHKFCWFLCLLVGAPVLCPECLPAFSALFLVPRSGQCTEGKTHCSMLAHSKGGRPFLGVCPLKSSLPQQLSRVFRLQGTSHSQKQKPLYINLAHVFYSLCCRKEVSLCYIY